MPELGWAGTVGVVSMIGALVVALVLYHVWFDRRRDSDADRKDRGR